MENKTQKEERLKKVLSSPFLDDFPEQVLKIRRNLLAVSSLALVLVLSDLEIRGGNFLGLHIEGLNTELIKVILFYGCLYHLIHFLFQSVDYVDKWRMRVTSSVQSNRPVRADHNEDYSYDPNQSTLYNWWEGMMYSIKSPDLIFSKLEEVLCEFEKCAEKIEKEPEIPNKNFAVAEARKVVSEFKRIKNSYKSNLENIEKLLKSERILISLKNFDNWFWNYQWFQVTRLIFIEFTLPVLLGVAGIIAVSPYSIIVTLVAIVGCALSLGILPFVFKSIVSIFE